MLKKVISIVIVLLFCISFGEHRLTVSANENSVDLGIESSGCVLIEVSTNKIIYEKNSNEKMYPASMTKMMGMLLTLEAIHENKIKFEQEVNVSLEASKMGGSQVYLEPGEIITIEELFKCVAIASANDAMYALAETIAGSENQFVNKMNEKAKKIGMKNTNFVNTTGFDDPNHYSTPKDMGLLARELINKFENEVTKYTSQVEGYIRQDSDNPFWLVNTNRLLGDYQGLDGLKTGFTQDAGFCLTSTAKRDNLRLISVVMNAKTKEIRSKDTVKLLDYGFANYQSIKLYEKGEIIGNVEFKHSKNENTPIIVNNDVYISVKKGETIDTINKEIVIEKYSAPIKNNEKIGYILIRNSDNDEIKIELFSGEEVEFLHWYDYFISLFLDMLC